MIFVPSVLILAFLFPGVLLMSSGCGGGGAAQTAPPPLPPADFAITLSSNSLSVPQGATSSPVNISVNGQDGFTGAVQVALSGLPTGVVSNPVSPFSVAASASVPVLFGATSNAGTGSFTITAQGTSGALSHSATFALTIQSSSVAALPRTTYARTDSTPAMDDPPGEARHRRIAYDPANKHVFVANRAMNRIDVFSATDQTRVVRISVPGASSADLSPDGATLWVGTVTQQVVAIDTASLQVKSRYAIQPVSPVPNESYDRPEELLALSNGNCLVRLRESSGPDALLALWNPATNSLTTSTAAEQYGFGALARTGDHAKVIIATNDANSDLAIFDSNGSVLVGPLGLGKGSTPFVAANTDGSRFAVVFVSNGASQLLLLDGALNRVGTASISVQGLTFSRDAKLLYVSGSAAAFPAIEIFDGRSLQTIGQVPDASIQGVQSEIEDVDETQLIFGIANRGVSFIDACGTAISGCAPQPGTLPSSVPSFTAAPIAQPSEGPAVGGTSTSLTGQNFESTVQVKFGQQIANAASVAGPTLLQATSPPSASNGAANVAAYFPSGWLAIAPDAFSFGPQILEVLPNAGTKSGGESVQIYGYGFGTDASTTTVNIGGANATVQKVENVSSIAPSLGLDSTYPFPLQRIALQTPPGTPGKANIVVTSAVGTATTSNTFQYLQSPQVYANKALYKFLLYDQTRQFVYLSATDRVDVFDLHAGVFKPGGLPLYCPSRMLAGPCPNADVRGLALTPDGSQLIAADFGSQNIFLLNPDSPGAVSFVPINVPGFGPARVAATSTQKVFVSLASIASAGPCSSCLTQLDLTATPPAVLPAPQPEVSTLTGSPLLQADAAGDRVFLAFDAAHGGPMALWNAAAPNDFTTLSANESPTDVAASADGTMFAASANGATEVRSADLTLIGTRATPELEQVLARTPVPGIAMHPTGALLYQPFLIGPAPATPSANGLQGGIDILDAHSGRLRLRVFLPEPLATLSSDIDALHGEFLTVDENGQRIFALTTSGLTVVQLASVPLGIGTVSPGNGPAAGGTALTIRGSGFQTGTTATIGGKNASVTFKDMNTLTVVTPPMIAGPQQLVIANPDGETMSLDAAFTAN